MISFFTKHPNAANLLMIGIIILGITALPNLKRDTFPELKNDKVQITAIYKGATAIEVEDAICRRIEDALEGTDGLDETQCEAREGRAIATAKMFEDTDMARFLDDVKSEIETISDFPSDVEDPIIKEIGRTSFLASIAVTGPNDLVDLKSYSEMLRIKLQSISAIADVDLRGFSDRQINIEIPLIMLEQFSLSTLDVANSIKSQNISQPLGQINGINEDIILRFGQQRKSVSEFANIIIISSATGAEIKLGDIATISNYFENNDNNIIFNDKIAAMLDIYKAKSDDVLQVIAEVKEFIENERAIAPKGISLTLSRDAASIVESRLDLLLSNGLQGLILVVLILGLFFSIRFSFWVAMGLPVSFLGTLFVMYLLDMSLNQITMVGLLIAIGLLMDDAIVISENIAVRLKKGDKAINAAINGVSEVLPGILSSFATTIFIFGALIFLDGTLGQILGVLPVVLIVTLAVSLLEAFFILPHHLADSLKYMGNTKIPAFKQAFERGFENFKENSYGKLLDIAIKWRYMTIGLIIMLLIVSFSLMAGGVLKMRGFPDIEGDIVEARILLPQGTPLSKTEQIADHLVKSLKKVDAKFSPLQPDGKSLVRNIAVIFSSNSDAYETGPHVATVSADLLSAEIRTTNIDEIFTSWRQLSGDMTDVIAIKYSESTVGPAGRAIDLRFAGNDLLELKSAASRVMEYLKNYDGINDLSDDLRPGKRELRLSLKDGSSILGLSPKNIADQLRTSFQGIIIDEFPNGSESYEVNLDIANFDRNNINDLRRMNLIGSDGVLIPLLAVVDIEEIRGWARINRYDGMRTISVQGDVDTRITNTAEIISNVKTDLIPDLLDDYPNLKFSIEGESANSAETQKSMGKNMMMGMFGVYILLAFQFRSYFVPILVMAVIPTALIGVIWGHFILGLEISMPSLIGGASLAGVVVNNSILMMQFISQKLSEGATTIAAAAYAGRIRFRSITLTTLTTVVGLLPLLLERSTQAQILVPLAVSLAFGLAIATVLSLFLMPSLYCVMADLGLVKNGRKQE